MSKENPSKFVYDKTDIIHWIDAIKVNKNGKKN